MIKISKKIKRKIVIISFSLLGVILVYAMLALISFDPTRQPKLGVTFSKQFSQDLGLNWKENYLAILDDLKIKYLRIPTYWDEVEAKEGKYDFSDIDWMVKEASKRNVKVVLTLGMRQPRWPECHFPDWAKNMKHEIMKIKVKELIFNTVLRYRNNPTIDYWQVENEPLLEFFGECPRPDRQLIKDEIDLVRALDSSREIVITASGELSFWYPEALWGDVLGSTLYRYTWSKYTGYSSYWFIPPSFYRVKAFLLGKDINKFWISELQAEPWFPSDPLTTPIKEQYKTMSPEKLIENFKYALRVNPERIYFWGAEWWYYTKVKLGRDDIWNTVKSINW